MLALPSMQQKWVICLGTAKGGHPGGGSVVKKSMKQFCRLFKLTQYLPQLGYAC
jgi:hypothetical protein